MENNKIKKILERYPFVERENLIPILQDIQYEYGHLTEEAVKEVGNYLELPASKIYSVATFYSKFRFQPRGKFHLKLCRGTSCQIKGAEKLEKKVYKYLGIMNGETSGDGMFSLEVVACMGCCGLGPVMALNNRYYTEITEDKLEEIIDDYKESEE
ncbi:MAG: NADH-quinone oxidoreductase subunit NuoE [Bacteroidales bacterium]|nr:NADH-quinone oxidoreductase subunit NuoE [Bacteroidales bacterium]